MEPKKHNEEALRNREVSGVLETQSVSNKKDKVPKKKVKKDVKKE